MAIDISSQYVSMPQNDLHQIEQVVREYEGSGRGLAHGLQKDAIQNGFGARLIENENRACKKWRFTFELLEIDGMPALIFWDEGTTGLTGDILSVEEIEKMSAEEKLTPEQNLSRFLTRFESGGNLGAGSFGRGKLIFQGASKTASIICDSLRDTDKQYIAFDRKIVGIRLVQQRVPFRGNEAKEFIKKASNGALIPLTASGTRITILNLKDEIVDAVKNSFNSVADSDYSNDFIKMIEETWWEIIKFGAKIYVKRGDNIRLVELSEPLKSIAYCGDDQNGYRAFNKELIPVVIGNETYRIKELKFVVAPNPLDEDLREIWIQRKRMKIGSISRNINPHHTIHKRFCGYIILEPLLEDIILLAEGTTHYGFNLNRKGVKQIRDIIRTELDNFQQRLGLRLISPESASHQDMLDAMKEINQAAQNLGLLTEFSIGPKSKDMEISIESFILPNPNSKRIEYGEDIGPIVYSIKNNSLQPKFVTFYLTAEQRGASEKTIITEEIDLKPQEITTVTVQPFQFQKEDFNYSEGVLIKAKLNDRNLGTTICQVSRILWIGREEPEIPEKPITVTAYQPIFPRHNSNRVELTEVIKNIRFKISNSSAVDIRLGIDLIVRKANKKTGDFRTLKRIINEEGVCLSAFSDKEFATEQILISNEDFKDVAEGPANADERRCEIYFSIHSSENVPLLELNKSDRIDKKSIPFYLGIDPPGQSIFKNAVDWEGHNDGKRSKYEGDRATGFTFILNVDHSAYKFMNEYSNEVRQYYIKEEMLKQAYAIAIGEGVFKGSAEDFEIALKGDNIPPHESFLTFEEIIGRALNEMAGQQWQ